MDKTSSIRVENAVDAIISASAPVSENESLSLWNAAGRVSAGEVVATIPQPPFDRSPLDGYAVNHADLTGASREQPARLRVGQCIYAGDECVPVRPGGAARLMTGSPIPAGADCVVRQEDTDMGAEIVSIYVSHNRHDNYCFKGEYVRDGQVLVRRGDELNAARLGLLAGQGNAEALVFRKPRIGIVSTGSELVPAGMELGGAQIHDSNSVMLGCRVADLGGEVAVHRHESDDPRSIADAVLFALDRCDAVVTTGGVSVGEKDYLPEAAEMLGARQLFHGVDVMPGSPALGLVRDGKAVVCLSGNPFAAFVTFELFAAPLVRHLAGRRNVLPERISGVLETAYPKKSGARRFVPAVARGGRIGFSGKPGLRSLASLVGCNCMLDIPAGSGALAAGDGVEAILL